MAVEADIAYMAGFFDGEGCIGVYAMASKGTGYFNLAVRVAQAEPEPLKLFADNFGGEVRQDGRGYWYWVLYNQKAEDALAVLTPYLRAKREQAEATLGFSGKFKTGERMTKTKRAGLHRDGVKIQRRLTLLKGRAA